jgi:hypothetical protein
MAINSYGRVCCQRAGGVASCLSGLLVWINDPYLFSNPLAAYMKERMAEADSLQKIAAMDEFYTRLEDFNQKWDVYKMAAAIRESS